MINDHRYRYEHQSCMINDHRFRHEHWSSMIIDHEHNYSWLMIVAMKCCWSYMISVDQWVISWTLTHCDNSEVPTLSSKQTFCWKPSRYSSVWLSIHNWQVSANLCLTSSHTGGELYILGQDGDITLQHRFSLSSPCREPWQYNNVSRAKP